MILGVFFGTQRFREDQGYDSPQKDPTSNFLRTAVKAFNRKALDVPETVPRGGLESVESKLQQKKPLKPFQPWFSAGRCKSNIRIIVKPRLNRGCKICVTVFWCCF